MTKGLIWTFKTGSTRNQFRTQGLRSPWSAVGERASLERVKVRKSWIREKLFSSSQAGLLLVSTKNYDLWHGPIFWVFVSYSQPIRFAKFHVCESRTSDAELSFLVLTVLTKRSAASGEENVCFYILISKSKKILTQIKLSNFSPISFSEPQLLQVADLLNRRLALRDWNL